MGGGGGWWGERAGRGWWSAPRCGCFAYAAAIHRRGLAMARGGSKACKGRAGPAVWLLFLCSSHPMSGPGGREHSPSASTRWRSRRCSSEATHAHANKHVKHDTHSPFGLCEMAKRWRTGNLPHSWRLSENENKFCCSNEVQDDNDRCPRRDGKAAAEKQKTFTVMAEKRTSARRQRTPMPLHGLGEIAKQGVSRCSRLGMKQYF